MLDVAISNWEGARNEAKHKYVTPLCYVYTQVSIYIGFYFLIHVYPNWYILLSFQYMYEWKHKNAKSVQGEHEHRLS